MRLITLTQGEFAQVDDADYEWLIQWKWCAHKQNNGKYYVVGGMRDKTNTMQLMHRLIMNAPKGIEIDHIDRDGLNNQRNNLRFSTKMMNAGNASKKEGCSSIYRGVTWDKRGRKWIAQIMCNYKNIFIGTFNNEIDAAKAYDIKAGEIFGKFANPNFK